MSGASNDGCIKTKEQTAERADNGGFEKWGVQLDLLSFAFWAGFAANRIRTVLIS
jgi:hypothetical protein